MPRRAGGPDLHPADAALLARLGAVVDVVDPVPADVVAAGRELFALRDPGAALMELVEVDDAAAAVRGAAVASPSRIHFFELGTPPDDLALDVQVEVDGGAVEGPRVTVLGVLLLGSGDPVPAGWSLAVQTARGSHPAVVGSDGGFRVGGLAPGLLRMVVRRPGEAPVATPWLEAR
ncbi:hypothetical protein [Lapillicoccus jejuensis]|uniref:Uncharacterized protein n=1 Tax=Lapillicoccus jejuensis TaxID=402171 RepID=A0A542DZ63_9MICO|nr:hypothetical protein [Lapillicoccus jejuensis]TQJ08383.1 hypothetical protein FB458_1471 [Lapillicoccus jejuensis]